MIGSTLAPAEHLTKVTKIYNEVTIGGLRAMEQQFASDKVSPNLSGRSAKNGVVRARTSTGTAGSVRDE